MKDKRFKSKLNPHFSELYHLRKQSGYTYNMLSEYMLKKHNIKITAKSVLSFLKAREGKGIMPSKRSLINILRKDDGSENKINISGTKPSKPAKKETEETKKSGINIDRLDEIMKELGIN
jgi:hypothetical protein